MHWHSQAKEEKCLTSIQDMLYAGEWVGIILPSIHNRHFS